MTRRSASQADSETVVRLPVRGRPRGADRAPVGIQAVDIALEILDGVAANRAGINLAALSRKTGVKPSKLHRYLVSLTRGGLLTQMPLTGLYDLGPYARQIGMAALNRFDEMGHVHRALTAFVAETGHALALYVWTDLGPALVRLELGTYAFPAALRVGSTLPLCTSATGRVFLAYLPDTITRPFVERELAVALAEGLPLSAGPMLADELGKIRSDRLYVTTDAIIPCLAVVGPIFDTHGNLFCTLTALAPRGTGGAKQRAKLCADVRRTVDRISEELFGTSPTPAPKLPTIKAGVPTTVGKRPK